MRKMSEDIDLIIRNARLIDAERPLDIAVKDDKIVIVNEGIKITPRKELDAGGRLTSPAFIDAHMHLDSAFLGGDLRWATRKLAEAVEIVDGAKQTSASDDVKVRAKRAAKIALGKGTTAFRTHVALNQMIGLTPLKALLELKAECSNWIDMQVVAFATQSPFTTSKIGESLLKKGMKLGADVVGGLPNVDPNPEKYLDTIFEVAKEFNAKIDLHVDESNDPNEQVLELYAEKTLENGYGGKVTASHCCALSAYSDDISRRVISKVRKAEMSVIANPFTNLYLLGEDGKPNGITRVNELLDAGVNVTYATDNTGDPFNPLGNADMLLAALFLAYQKKLEDKDPLAKIFKMGTLGAAKATEIIRNYGIKKGGRADLMILDAESPEEAIVSQVKRLYIIKNGKIVVENGNLTF